jgi:hypothetical protein
VQYLTKVEAFALVNVLSRIEFGFRVRGSESPEALGANRVEGAVQVSPMGKIFAIRVKDHGAAHL